MPARADQVAATVIRLPAGEAGSRILEAKRAPSHFRVSTHNLFIKLAGLDA